MLFFELEVEARRLHNTYPPLWKRQSEPLEVGGGGALDLVSRNYQLIIYVYAEPGGGSKAYLPLFPIPERRGRVHTLCITAHSYVRGEGPWGKGFFIRPPPTHP